MLAFRKSYEIVGYTLDGDIYCLACADPAAPDSGYGPNPVFLDQTDGTEVCGSCHEPIG